MSFSPGNNVRRLPVLVLALAPVLPGAARAEPDYSIPDIPDMEQEEPAGSSWWPEDTRARLYGVFSALEMDVADEGPFNPDNFAGLPERGREGELRPELVMPVGECETNLKPRLRATRLEINERTESETEFFFNAAYLSCPFGYSVEVTAGRRSLQWGNGQYRSPSNPFFAESVLFNPAQEILGKDFVTVSYRPGMNWGLTYIAHLDNSHLDPGSERFERAHGVKLDWTGRSFNGGIVASTRHGQPGRLSAYSTFTLSDAVLVYGEATASRDAAGLLPTGDDGTLLPAEEVDDRRRETVLAGASYTFESGLTAYAEYLHSTEGFNDDQAADWLAIAERASDNLAGPGPGAAPAAFNLANAIDPGWRQLRGDYLFVQLAQTEYRQKADLALRYVRNLDDEGYEISAAVTVRLGDHAEWFLTGGRNYGGPETEFGRLNRYVVQTGFRIYAF